MEVKYFCWPIQQTPPRPQSSCGTDKRKKESKTEDGFSFNKNV